MTSEGTPPSPHGPWWAIAELPPELKDGRDVLLWGRARPLVAFWANYEDGDDWSTDDGLRPEPTMFAEIVHPCGSGPIHNVWQDECGPHPVRAQPTTGPACLQKSDLRSRRSTISAVGKRTVKSVR